MRSTALIALLLAGWTVAVGQPYFNETTPFISGQGGYHTYRIPAIVRATNGTLLAFCEGRKNSSSDAGDIDLVLRRSSDEGATWQPMQMIQEEGGSASITIGNPAPVVDEQTGEIHMLFCRNNSRVFHIKSIDNGVTWSARKEITSSVKLPGWDWYATGPGHGIQLKRGKQAGRLVVACDFVATNGLRGAHVILSDDHGATWRLGAVNTNTGGVNPNETLCEELVGTAANNGSRIYFNTRDQGGAAAGTRGQAWSDDGGSTFLAAFTNRTEFVCPVVQGSVVRFHEKDLGDPTNRLLFACPNSPSSRVMISVWSSFDESASWGPPRLVYEGPSAYSDMARTGSGEVGLLYERGAASPYETIAFARFNDAWLDATTPAPASDPRPGFWNFEEKTPGMTADTNIGSIKNVHPAGTNGHLTSQSTFLYVAGATNFGSGSALSFDGTGGLQLPDSESDDHFDFGAEDSFTLEAVFRVPAGASQIGALIAKDYGSTLPSWWLRLESGKPRFLVSDNAVENSVLANVLVNDGFWHHIAAVRDARVSTAKLLSLYIDGVLITNKTDSTTGSLANSQPLNVGRFGASATRNLVGDIDMVRITPRVVGPTGFLKTYTQFDADSDGLPDSFERSETGTLGMLSAGDADGDHCLDLAEYALGSDPLEAASLPVLMIERGTQTIQIGSHQRTLPPWLAVDLVGSGDLANWLPCTGVVNITSIGNGVWARIQTVDLINTNQARFFRMSVNELPW